MNDLHKITPILVRIERLRAAALTEKCPKRKNRILKIQAELIKQLNLKLHVFRLRIPSH